jgi:outer membrane protein TolC
MKRTSSIAASFAGRRIAWTSALLATFVSAGCATARVATPTPKTDAPQAWSRTVDGVVAGADDLGRWWERLGDQTLSGLVDQALKNNPDVRTARARLRQARAQRVLAHANLFPSVSASGSASGNKNSKSDATGSFSANIDASWEPDVFGGLKASERAAAADYAATEEDLHNTQVSLAAEVAINYVDLRGYQARLAIARANAASQAETLQITEWRAQAGLVSSLDVEQARTSLAQTQASIPSLESSVTRFWPRSTSATCALLPT